MEEIKNAKEFIYNKYPHLKHPLEGKNPIIDFELDDLCEWFEEYANLKANIQGNKTTQKQAEEYLESLGIPDDIYIGLNKKSEINLKNILVDFNDERSQVNNEVQRLALLCQDRNEQISKLREEKDKWFDIAYRDSTKLDLVCEERNELQKLNDKLVEGIKNVVRDVEQIIIQESWIDSKGIIQSLEASANINSRLQTLITKPTENITTDLASNKIALNVIPNTVCTCSGNTTNITPIECCPVHSKYNIPENIKEKECKHENYFYADMAMCNKCLDCGKYLIKQ